MSWIVSESIRNKNENVWFKKHIYTRKSNIKSKNVRQITLILIWTFVDKIKFQSKSSNMLVILIDLFESNISKTLKTTAIFSKMNLLCVSFNIRLKSCCFKTILISKSSFSNDHHNFWTIERMKCIWLSSSVIRNFFLKQLFIVNQTF